MYTEHNKAYKRHKAQVHMRQKENIVKNCWGISSDFTPTILLQPHRLDKNKVHCSCPMCSAKTRRNGWKHSDTVNLEKGWEMSEDDFRSDDDMPSYHSSNISTDRIVYTTTIDNDIDWEILLDICENDRKEIAEISSEEEN